MKTRKVFNLITKQWIEVPDDSNFTSTERIPISYKEFIRKNCGPNAKIKAFSDLTPEEQKNYYEDKEE
jgi:hypothetical protein